jgi:hypothetical protein
MMNKIKSDNCIFNVKGKNFGFSLQILGILIFLLANFINCGLLDRKLPPNGLFCNVLAKPVNCIEIEFSNLKIKFSENEIYPLEMVSRVEYYYYLNPTAKIQMLVTSEHRVQLSDGRFFLRKKVKR